MFRLWDALGTSFDFSMSFRVLGRPPHDFKASAWESSTVLGTFESPEPSLMEPQD